ncbi:MAG TPA: conjugal transfer protein TrbL, partial [Mycobacterium sp.]
MSVCDLPGISDVCQGTTAAGDSLAALPFEWLAQALGDTAKQAVDLAWSAMTTTTLVDVQAPG